jgi:hypothetical protein
MVEGVLAEAALEHPGLHLGQALQLDRVAVGLVPQAVGDVGGQRRGVKGVERGLGREVVVGRLPVREPGPPAPGGLGHEVDPRPFHGPPRGHDRFVHPQAGERARAAELGRQQGGAAHGVSRAHQRPGRDGELVHHRQDVVGHARPVEVHRRGRGAVAVAAEVERPRVGHIGQLRGHRGPGHAQEPGGMAEEHGNALPAQVVQRDRDAAGRGHQAGGAGRRDGGGGLPGHPPMLAAGPPTRPTGPQRR